MPINLYATFLALRQPEPPEGRKALALGTGNGGGDGMTFATGNEIFQFSTEQVPGAQKVSGILGMWVDATNLTAGKNLIIQTPYQTFVFAGGNQGYIPMTSPVPLTVKVSTNGGTGTVSVILYNYNPLFTGSVATTPPTGGSGSGSGGGGALGPNVNQGGGGRPRIEL